MQSPHLGTLGEGHASRDGPEAKAMLLQLDFQPVDGAVELTEDKSFGSGVSSPHILQLHGRQTIREAV